MTEMDPAEASAAFAESLREYEAKLRAMAPETDVADVPDDAEAFVWHAVPGRLEAVRRINRLDIEQLVGVDRSRDTLLENTRRFAEGFPANNALLWGARGMGKSSLVKAIHAEINARNPGSLALIEIHREEIASLPRLLPLVPHGPALPSQPSRGVVPFIAHIPTFSHTVNTSMAQWPDGG